MITPTLSLKHDFGHGVQDREDIITSTPSMMNLVIPSSYHNLKNLDCVKGLVKIFKSC
jgi:hypothetical protein